MTDNELNQLRQRVDRDTDLTPTARLLFSEVINLSLLGDGCYKDYTTLAEDLGLAPRTVRRRRDELHQAGYLEVSKQGDRRYLVPKRPDTGGRTGQECPDTDGRTDTDDRTKESAPDTGGETPPDTDDRHREVDNPAEAQEAARSREGRWDFLPSYRARHLPEIKQEAGGPDHNPDVLGVARRYLNEDEDDLAATVDYHLEQRPKDEVIAAYVIAGREADSPLQYADKIIREGWTEDYDGGGAPSDRRGHIAKHGDDPVVHFGQHP